MPSYGLQRTKFNLQQKIHCAETKVFRLQIHFSSSYFRAAAVLILFCDMVTSRLSFILWLFFFYQGFLHRHWRFTGQHGKGGDHLLFHSATSIRSRTLRHLFKTLYVRWLPHIFNRNPCVYQTATRWDLPRYRITNGVIDWWCTVCLLTWSIDTRLCYSDLTLETGGFELASIITPVLQANRLTKCASHPNNH